MTSRVAEMLPAGDTQRALSLFIAYMAVQSTAAADVRRASRIAGSLEPLGAVLARLEAGDQVASIKAARAVILDQ